ncbi:hypothetical protein QJ854_gp672 [Moumouvirus goulette]|uniref:Uncharacterized protein n=1 Tax=Moumouvirus goulette TaxID=1247379 RepID=M1NM59_9VIRU|nr:hypothetical protein QJ854_gp672 [Moumouvirus goulette]AGF85110.1 hypothetical protein glt_00301 [Moumouvirus goulette]
MFLTVKKIIQDIRFLYPDISNLLSLILTIHHNEIFHFKNKLKNKLINRSNKKLVKNNTTTTNNFIHGEIYSIRHELENIIYELKKLINK